MNKVPEEFPDTAALLGAVLEKLVPHEEKIVLTRDEVENAPDVKMKEIGNQIVELRVD